MNDDEEMLEFAARAAGYGSLTHASCVKGCQWDPRTDDGDALRLAVRLGIEAKRPSRSRSIGRVVQAWYPLDGDYRRSANRHVSVAVNGDRLASTRHAITRAAAEIGKAMLESAADHTAPQSPPPA